MKKKMVVVFFAAVMLLSLTACGGRPGARPKRAESTEVSTSSKASSAESTSSTVVESTEESSSAEPVETTSPLGNSSYFTLMIEAAQSQIPTLKEQLGEMYSDISITEGANSTVVYTYTLAQDPLVQLDGEALKPTMIKGVRPVMDGMKSMIPDAKIQVIYLRPDGSELLNFTITQEDLEQPEAEATPA